MSPQSRTKPRTKPASHTRKTGSATGKGRKPPGAAFANKNSLPTRPPDSYYYVLDVPFHARDRAAHYGAVYVERMQPRQAPNVHAWVYVGRRLPEGLKPYACTRYTRHAWYQADLNDTAPTTAPEPDHSLGMYTLREDQAAKRDSELYLWQAGGPGVLDCSTTGVGKTLTTLATVKALPGVLNVLIVAPKGALPGWYQHLRDAGDGGKRWCRVNYESIRNLLSMPKQAKVKDKSKANNNRVDLGEPLVKWDVIICDEAHVRGNPASQLERTLQKLIAYNNAFVVNVSATVTESPAKGAFLHRELAFASGNTINRSLNIDDYAQWCQRVGISVTTSGSGLKWTPNTDDAETYHHFLFNTTPTWAVTGTPSHWPKPERLPHPVELTPEELTNYNVLWEQFQNTMAQLQSRRASAYKARDQRAIRQVLQAGREAQIRYRQKASILRAPHVADYIVSQVDNGYQVAASFEFTNSTLVAVHNELVARGIAPAHHTGNNTATREQERIAYQQGKTPVILFSTTASINLHSGETAVQGNAKPRMTVVADPRWQGIAAIQIEGRSQRNGTFAPVRYMYALDTVEERVIKRMLEKMKTVQAIVGGDDNLLDDIASEMGITLFGEDQ